MPRKFKIAFSGCSDDCAGVGINDLGFLAREKGGERGFKVFVAGGMGANSRKGAVLEDFLPEREIGFCVKAVKNIFYNKGNRKNKYHNRLRFLVQDDLGFPEFKRLYEQELKEVKGKELEGKKYEPLFPYFKKTPNAFQFLLADFVTVEEGTGIVHTAPAFGEDDNIVSRKYNIPIVQPVDENGKFTKEVADYAGQYVHNTNEQIVIDLKKSGKAVMSRKMEHEYPFCYRCDTKLIYRALPAWFVNIEKIKKRLLKLNLKINWFPEYLKEGRMQHNISTSPDWNITRNRYWATAIPIWKSESGKIKVIGSIEELKQFAKKLPKKIDLHKDCLDEIKLEIDGEEYKRIPEVIDCWFESGSMTFAQFHYPFENKEVFKSNFPADFIAEGLDQTRGWFYSLLVLSVALFDEAPFKNVVVNGMVLAEDGQKMSKKLRNYPDPKYIIDKYGADAIRYYLLSSPIVHAESLSLSEKGINDILKKVIMRLMNVLTFYVIYSDGQGIELKEESTNVLDKWIIARLKELSLQETKSLEMYELDKAFRPISNFVDDLSTWYIRRSRDRFKSENIQEKSERSEERRVGKECRSRWSPYH